jgi:hypothetical protein
MSALEAELAAAARRSCAEAVMLVRRRGLRAAVVARLNVSGEIGLAAMTIEGGGSRWSPEGPDQRLVIAVRDAFGVLIDLVAVASHDPQEWALRTGEGEMLGAALLDAAACAAMAERKPRVRVFSNPIAWLCGLQVEGLDLFPAGVCVVEWEAGLRALRGWASGAHWWSIAGPRSGCAGCSRSAGCRWCTRSQPG